MNTTEPERLEALASDVADPIFAAELREHAALLRMRGPHVDEAR